jgi:hypothetical protein
VHPETVDLGFIYETRKQKQIVDMMTDYMKHLSRESKVKIILFNLINLDIEEQVIKGTIITGSQITEGHADFPPLIYNFALHTTSNNIETMRILRKAENTTVINPINWFKQGIIFEMLASLTNSEQYLLPIAPFNESTLTEYLDSCDKLFLLPEKTVLSPKAVVIKKLHSHDYMISIGQNSQLCRKDGLLNYIQKMICNKKYIVMKGIDCFNWMGSPMEARVYLQKNVTGEWSILKITVKKDIFSRNALYEISINSIINKLLSNEIKDTEKVLSSISLGICSFLDFHIPCLGSCTLDYIFDETQHPYLVYFGGFDQDSYLIRQMGTKEQYMLLNNVFQYLLFLSEKNDTEKSVTYDLDKSSQR